MQKSELSFFDLLSVDSESFFVLKRLHVLSSFSRCESLSRSAFNTEITEYLNKEFSKSYGIEVLDASIIDVHPDKKLKASIDSRVTALQEKQQAEAEQQKIKVQKETEKLQAEADAEIEITKAKAEAESNKIVSESITDELIRMKEAEARNKFGWVTVQGADTVVTDNK